MEIKYYCNDCKCREIREKAYVYTLKIEQIMDEKNIAQMFCPHCGKELNSKKL